MAASGSVDTIILSRLHEVAVSVYRHRADGIGHVIRNDVLQSPILFGQLLDFLHLAVVILHEPSQAMMHHRLIAG